MYLRAQGFPVQAENVPDLGVVKRRHAVPAAVETCHTAVVGGYVVEGHVPADLIDRLLRERPKVAGIGVAGMPTGSPGMESPGRPPERYEVLAWDASGRTTVFARR